MQMTMRFSLDGRRVWRRVALACIVAALAIGGCAELAQKERELVFRVVPGDASWYAGLPDGVREIDIPVANNEHIHAWWWKADKADAHVSEQLLREDAEKALYAATQRIAPEARTQFESGDYTGSLQTLAALRGPVDAFFDDVMVNAEEADLRLNRLGLLATLHQAMNRVADLSRLAQ